VNAKHFVMEKRFYDAHQQLSVAQEAINCLKTQLENQKFGNIFKVIDEFLRERQEFIGTEYMNIDALVHRLDPAQTELEELAEFAEKFDGKVQKSVKNQSVQSKR
jgi:hypothetical protein